MLAPGRDPPPISRLLTYTYTLSRTLAHALAHARARTRARTRTNTHRRAWRGLLAPWLPSSFMDLPVQVDRDAAQNTPCSLQQGHKTPLAPSNKATKHRSLPPRRPVGVLPGIFVDHAPPAPSPPAALALHADARLDAKGEARSSRAGNGKTIDLRARVARPVLAGDRRLRPCLPRTFRRWRTCQCLPRASDLRAGPRTAFVLVTTPSTGVRAHPTPANHGMAAPAVRNVCSAWSSESEGGEPQPPIAPWQCWHWQPRASPGVF